MTTPHQALVGTDWLHERLGEVRVLDGSWHLPSTGRSADAEFADEHIPGAQRFDIDAVADASSSLPHMLPAPEQFAAAVSAMGIGNDDHVVVYDTQGLFSAARVWWMFRVFGHERVSVLDGGLPAWKAKGHPVTAELAQITPTRFEARFRPELVADLERVRDIVADGSAQILDNRSADRFHMRVPEPRPHVRAGRMPGATNLPMGDLLDEGGRLLRGERLRRVLGEAGVDPTAPSVCSCGSGVTACVAALALYTLGHESAAVYDGSWTEWGSRDDTPIETG
ncbi:MAG: 3-mercaptopyruvate sulfurtransferase [Myxococcales bacterium]|jgi:thiosulfate/3-mercaptopyruvate sulfurtransferase